MKQNLFITSLVMLIFLACSLFENDEGVVLSTSSDQLIIENNMGVKIYYFSFDKDLEGLADWIPIKDENETVKAEESKK